MIKKFSVFILYVFVFGLILLRYVDAYGNGDKKPVEKPDKKPEIVIEEKGLGSLTAKARRQKRLS
jgi:hypothetical protein